MPNRLLGNMSSGGLTGHALRRIGLLVLAVILVARGVPIVDALSNAEPVSTAFDEDAYYEFAVARNLAWGNGITAGHGEHTNGFQPLWTFVLVPAFALNGSDRAALGSIYLLSITLWLTAAWLFARLITRHTESAEASLGGLATLLCLAIFLSDPRWATHFFSGLETGCYVTGLLLLWHWLAAERPLDGEWGRHRSFVFGLLLGALLLVRNDAVLIVPFVLLAGARRDGHARLRLVFAAAVAAAVFSPWVVYNYKLSGQILPQSGLATMIDAGDRAFDWFRVSTATRAVLEMTFPPLLTGVARLPLWCLAVFPIVLSAGLAWLCRRDAQAKRMTRSAAPLAVGCAALAAYYVVFSRATWMYPRYFMPLRLLSVAAWSLLILGALRTSRTWRSSIAAVLMLTAATTSVYRAAHSFFAVPPHMGEEVRLLIAAGLCDGPARVGMFESGRTGYRCAPQVINLDGKASFAALNALAEDRLLEHLASARIDQLCLRDYYVTWLDTRYPEWRQQFSVGLVSGTTILAARADAERERQPSAAER